MSNEPQMTDFVVIPAGEYRLGDPCYSVPNDKWIPWLEAADYLKDQNMLLAEIDGHLVLGFSTSYGDGSYMGSDGFRYGVDSGLIGLVPVETAWGKYEPSERLWTLVTFSHDVACMRFSDGMLTFGNIEIYTGDEYDEDEYDEDSEEYRW